MGEVDTPSGATSIVVIEAGRATAEVVIGAVDAALRSSLPRLSVHVPLTDGDDRRPTLEALCGTDSRISLPEPGAETPAADFVFELPAGARPEPWTLSRVVTVMGERGLETLEAPVPGRYARMSALGAHGKLRARAAGSGTSRLGAAAIGLRSTASRGEPPPRPKGTLAQERAEHLRHRARSATMRARVDRHAHRLSRERLQTRHERARRALDERRLGATGAGEWIRWRSRTVGRRAAALPGLAASAARSAGSFTRRARRFAADRRRSRKLEA
jgi:hypothetical protein